MILYINRTKKKYNEKKLLVTNKIKLKKQVSRKECIWMECDNKICNKCIKAQVSWNETKKCTKGQNSPNTIEETARNQ